MNLRKLTGVLFVLVLALAACAPTGTESTATGIPLTEPPATEPEMTESPVVDTPVVTDEPIETATVSVPVTGDADVQVSETDPYGPVLVNGEGMSLYVFMSDTQDAGTSACTAGCAGIWPPFMVDAEPAAGDDLDASLLGTITRDDGSTQATYNGWPLYLYAGDTAPGDTTGQGITDEYGLWYLIGPDGEPIQQ
jgi:predicted lipoprotein with Yx(FWY)xxD motif